MDETNLQNFNVVKEKLLDTMAKEGYLTPERATEFCKNYAVIITKKNWLGRLVDRVLYRDDEPDNYKIIVAKLV